MDPSLAAVVSTSSVTLAAALVAGLLLTSAVRSLEAAKASLEGSVRTMSESAQDVMEKF
jgi:hypothetical protein